MFSDCAVSRGPTDCTYGTCYCKPGFCRVPDSTCHLTRTCWQGGLENSFCEKGLCMCKFGLYIGADGKCQFPSTNLMGRLSMANMTKEDLAFMKQQDNAVAFNVFMFYGWITILPTAFIAGSFFAYRRSRAKDAKYESGYAVLA